VVDAAQPERAHPSFRGTGGTPMIRLRQMGQEPIGSQNPLFIGTETSRFMKQAALRDFFLLSALRKIERFFLPVFRFTEPLQCT
jgi:hypothetical protein